MKGNISELAIQSKGSENKIIAEYEALLKGFFNAKYCLSLSSGTAAVIVALNAINVSRGDHVIMPPTAPLCTAYPVMSTGAVPIFGDVSYNTLGLDLSDVKEKVSSKTKAIIEVPMWGYATQADEIQLYAKKIQVPLIFDLAHCVGTKLYDKPLSFFCDIACFSTQKNKIFSTGEGGFIGPRR